MPTKRKPPQPGTAAYSAKIAARRFRSVHVPSAELARAIRDVEAGRVQRGTVDDVLREAGILTAKVP